MTITWTKNGNAFPLFEQLMKHNEKIEGIEQCDVHMSRERRRRKREAQAEQTAGEAKAFRQFARFKKERSQPKEAGFASRPFGQQSLPDPEELEMLDTVELIDPIKPFSDWKVEDQYDAYALPLIGHKAQVHGLENRSQFNGMIVT